MEVIDTCGETPSARFGHTITMISPRVVIMYGGAIGQTEKYTITGETFRYDIKEEAWMSLKPKGDIPPSRAAHAACCVEQNKMVIFGGAMGGGGSLVAENLHLLDATKGAVDEANWIKIVTVGLAPKKRYGHTLVFSKPHLILFGGNTGAEPENDVWVLAIDKTPLQWAKVEVTSNKVPPARVYHSAAQCSDGAASGMMVIFGGRGGNGAALNDTWGFRKHRNGKFDWIKAPYKSNKPEPLGRYQHQTLFVGPLMLVIGGRGNNLADDTYLDVYDTETSDWTKVLPVQKFRHSSWFAENYLWIHGGFDPTNPNIPTEALCRIYLPSAFGHSPSLTTSLTKTISSTGKGAATVIGTPQMNGRAGTVPSYQEMNSSGGVNSSTLTPKPMTSARTRANKTPSENKDFKLTNHAIVAEFYGEVSGGTIKQVPVDKLPEESKKIGIAYMKTSEHAGYRESLYKLFIGSFMKTENVIISTQRFQTKKEIILKLIEEVQLVLEQQETLLQLNIPVKIFGNIYGQYGDLMRFFDNYGLPDNQGKGHDIEGNDYVFLGNYVGRGKNSLEVICLLLALKLKFPNQIHLLRGSHEDEKVNVSNGFGEECQNRLQEDIRDSSSIFQRLNRLFEYFPIAALLENKVLCVHSGIGSSINSVDDFRIPKPYKISRDINNSSRTEKIVQETLWSSPADDQTKASVPASSSIIPELKFSKERIETFMKANQLDLIVRSRECTMEGYEEFLDTGFYTVFSCTNYGGSFGNKAALLMVKKNYMVVPKILEVSGSSTSWYRAPSSSSMEIENTGGSAMANRTLTPPRPTRTIRKS